jgi:hypothetical protein
LALFLFFLSSSSFFFFFFFFGIQFGSLFSDRKTGMRNQKACLFHLIHSVTEVLKRPDRASLVGLVLEATLKCHHRGSPFRGDRRFLNLLTESFRTLIQTFAQLPLSQCNPPTQILAAISSMLSHPVGDLSETVVILEALKEYFTVVRFREEAFSTHVRFSFSSFQEIKS